MLFGVPQGSILGPLLFIMFINDISKCIKHCRMQLYADDIALIASSKDTDEVHRHILSDMNRISSWCQLNGLTINAKKTKVVWHGSRSQIRRLKTKNITVKGTVLESPDSYQYLGVEIDNKLSMVKQVNNTIRTVSYKLINLGRLRYLVDKYTALQIYKQTVVPYFDYCSFLSEGATVAVLLKLQRLQNRGLKICKGNYDRIATAQLHAESKVQMLGERRKHQLLLIMFKQARKLKLRPKANPRTRSDHKIKFVVKRPRLERFKKSPFYRGVKLWNRLKPRVQLSDTKDQFQKRCLHDSDDSSDEESDRALSASESEGEGGDEDGV